jgi:hypothetical protein
LPSFVFYRAKRPINALRMHSAFSTLLFRQSC